MEQRIKDLCTELMASRDPDRIEQIGEELRHAIHQHIETLRTEAQEFPMLQTLLIAS